MGCKACSSGCASNFLIPGAESPQLTTAMAALINALQNPQALITLAVLGLAVVLFITGVIAPNSPGC